MTGWIMATATTAVLGIGAVVGPQAVGRTLQWVQDGEREKVLQAFEVEDSLEQAVKVFAGGGTRIGVSVRDLTDEDLKTTKGASSGVVIEQVEADSAAQTAGFKTGDIVVDFDGERIRSARQLSRLVQETVPDRQVQATVVRDGQRVTLNVRPRAGGAYRFDKWDAFPKVSPPVMKRFEVLEELVGGTPRLGITTDELSSQLAEYFGTKEGVLVTSVTDSSVASKAGLKAGDVITSLNGGAVTSPADLRRRAQRLEPGDELTLTVVRDKKTLTLKGKLEPPAPRRSTVRTIL